MNAEEKEIRIKMIELDDQVEKFRDLVGNAKVGLGKAHSCLDFIESFIGESICGKIARDAIIEALEWIEEIENQELHIEREARGWEQKQIKKVRGSGEEKGREAENETRLDYTL